MAKIHTIKVAYGRTVNLGNYENVKLDAEIELVMEEGDKVEDVYRQGWVEVVKEVNSKAQALKKLAKGEK